MAGQPSDGYGCTPVSSSRLTRCQVASTSAAVSSSRSRRPSEPDSMSRSSLASTATASRARGLPRHCHRTVRSLSSTEKQTPWSTPYTWPVGSGSRWPPLRSALLTTASNTAIRRTTGLRLLTSRMRSISRSVSIHSWHMPGPNGPSR
ncbi:hypothetical protein BKM31_06195 [[Actinomadura] parvosata subsp. kistnae]|uniref:Uncharacterized protein n=1 Tax=[Actinomadura] parvosata subsp. kistnae TaxID=1909395 RepID=A0A1U9ZT64_9ACTN|nr:hypothetical protein BKM31_06195 [Nonomuraea sp. ATCC 55076]